MESLAAHGEDGFGASVAGGGGRPPRSCLAFSSSLEVRMRASASTAGGRGGGGTADGGPGMSGWRVTCCIPNLHHSGVVISSSCHGGRWGKRRSRLPGLQGLLFLIVMSGRADYLVAPTISVHSHLCKKIESHPLLLNLLEGSHWRAGKRCSLE